MNHNWSLHSLWKTVLITSQFSWEDYKRTPINLKLQWVVTEVFMVFGRQYPITGQLTWDDYKRTPSNLTSPQYPIFYLLSPISPLLSPIIIDFSWLGDRNGCHQNRSRKFRFQQLRRYRHELPLPRWSPQCNPPPVKCPRSGGGAEDDPRGDGSKEKHLREIRRRPDEGPKTSRQNS